MEPCGGMLQLSRPSRSCTHPLGQSVHLTDALPDAYLPGLQGKQSTEPGLFEYDPGEHATRPEDSPSHLKPASHATVILETFMYEPGGTAVQPLDPSFSFLNPDGHSSQVVLPSRA